jgi:integrase
MKPVAITGLVKVDGMADEPRRKRKSRRVPKHREHASGQGTVELGGKSYYTGKWGSAASEARYRMLVGAWIAGGKDGVEAVAKPEAAPEGISVATLSLHFLNFVRATYIDDDGKPRKELPALEGAAKFLTEQAGLLAVSQLGRPQFIAMRDFLIRLRRSRQTVNQRMYRVKKIVGWGFDRGFVPSAVWTELRDFKMLKAGESGVRDTPRVRPVPDDVVEKTLPFLRPQLQTLVKLIRLTAARPGELCIMRPMDIVRRKDVWTFTPSKHKTQRYGGEREIEIGPKAQALLKPMLKGVADDGFVFCKVRKPGQPLDSALLTQAIKAAARLAKAPTWSAHKLRHARLTEIRDSMSLDHVQSVAGHSVRAMSEHYARLDRSKAKEVAKKSG